MSKELLEKFDQVMYSIYDKALKLNPPYRAKLFRQMLDDHGGKETADRLLATVKPSQGFTELYLRGKENLCTSVEYLVLTRPWRELFTDNQLAIARRRLNEIDCQLPPDDSL
ncbi:MAG TPA: hypothetical protein VN456_11415 [Desulfosporosinus sp.]|nr:hypothetical protein [Desulfosporosinus sp.]